MPHDATDTLLTYRELRTRLRNCSQTTAETLARKGLIASVRGRCAEQPQAATHVPLEVDVEAFIAARVVTDTDARGRSEDTDTSVG